MKRPKLKDFMSYYEKELNIYIDYLEKKFDKVTRLEIINHSIERQSVGRQYANYDLKGAEIELQDNKRTMKIFI